MTVNEAECIMCGRTVDTREEDEGGGADGAELAGGEWVCSGRCYDHHIAYLDQRIRADAAEAERNELIAIIARIDEVVPRADNSCEDPGITISEAVRRERNALKQEGE